MALHPTRIALCVIAALIIVIVFALLFRHWVRHGGYVGEDGAAKMEAGWADENVAVDGGGGEEAHSGEEAQNGSGEEAENGNGASEKSAWRMWQWC